MLRSLLCMKLPVAIPCNLHLPQWFGAVHKAVPEKASPSNCQISHKHKEAANARKRNHSGYRWPNAMFSNYWRLIGAKLYSHNFPFRFRAQVWSQTFHQPKPHAQKNRLNGHECFGVCQIAFCNHFPIQLFGALYLWNIHGRNVVSNFFGHDRDMPETSPRQDPDILSENFSGACAAPGRLIHVRPQAYRYSRYRGKKEKSSKDSKTPFFPTPSLSQIHNYILLPHTLKNHPL